MPLTATLAPHAARLSHTHASTSTAKPAVHVVCTLAVRMPDAAMLAVGIARSANKARPRTRTRAVRRARARLQWISGTSATHQRRASVEMHSHISKKCVRIIEESLTSHKSAQFLIVSRPRARFLSAAASHMHGGITWGSAKKCTV